MTQSPDHELKVTGFVHRQAMPRIVSDPPVRLVREARRYDLALNELRARHVPSHREQVTAWFAIWLSLFAVAYFGAQFLRGAL
jgi:hypothetical protein